MMKNLSILLTGILAILLSVVAVAADVSGKWKAEFNTPDGTQRVNTFTFKVDGEKLTGTVAGTQDETPIQNAKINGDEISFTAERPFGTFTYSGKVSGNEIKFKVTFNDQNFEMTAKRVPN
ncbi:MAG: hypothetical protein ABSH49_25070 [Bryobacteraceae bacterium]